MSPSSSPPTPGPSGSQVPFYPLYWNQLPSIQILRPGKGRNSPKVDERCFTYCSQTAHGRNIQSEPWCRTICIRRVFEHEVKRTLASHHNNHNPFMHTDPHHSGAAPHPHSPGDDSVDAKLPLPPEGQHTPNILGAVLGSPKSADDEEDGWKSIAGTKRPDDNLKYWKEGWYIWLSKSRYAVQDKLDSMSFDLEKQVAWEKYKEKVNEDWAEYERKQQQTHGRQGAVGELAVEDHGHVRTQEQGPDPRSRAVASNEEHQHDNSSSAAPPPPFEDTAARSLLIPLPPPLPPIDAHIRNLLAPSFKLLSLTEESLSSGHQYKFAQRVWEKAGTSEPWVLARNVCRKMWSMWREGGEEDEAEGNQRKDR